MRRFALLLCILLSISPVSAQERYDIVISNGRVMDPETGLDAVRNVGIRGQTIVAITSDTLQATAPAGAMTRNSASRARITSCQCFPSTPMARPAAAGHRSGEFPPKRRRASARTPYARHGAVG